MQVLCTTPNNKPNFGKFSAKKLPLEERIHLEKKITQDKKEFKLDQQRLRFDPIVNFPPIQIHPNLEKKLHIQELEKTAKSLGVKAKLSSKNINRSELIVEALNRVTKAGFDLNDLEIKMTTAGDNVVLKKENDSVEKGKCLPSFDLIYFEKNDDPNYTRNNKSVQEPIGLILHEIGHYLHYKNNPGKFHQYSKKSSKELDTLLGKYTETLRQEVSEHAATQLTRCTSEVVAEIFAGSIGGKKYGSKVMELYRILGGPEF